MRIAHFFSGNPETGAASGAMNLCKGLIKENMNIEIYNDMFDFKIKDKEIVYRRNYKKMISSFMNNINDRKIFFTSKKKVKFSNGFTGDMPIPISEINKFDLIHLHWINNGFFNLEKINKINIPIVWTIRDMWPFTGGCHYTLGCNKFHFNCKSCPSIKNLLFNNDFILDLFKKKISVLKNKNIHLVGISKWIETEIKKSLIFKNSKVYQIYNCIDDDLFFPEKINVAREKLNLPQKKFIILIGSQKLNDKLKDNKKILELVDNKKFKDFYFITFGSKFNSFKNLKNFGFVNDKNILRKIYSAANIFMSFSKQEAFGKTIVESIMCNTPVISSDNISSKELIIHKENGYIVEDKNYSDAIQWIYNNLNKNIKDVNIFKSKKFSLKEISSQYIHLYSKILKKNNEF